MEEKQKKIEKSEREIKLKFPIILYFMDKWIILDLVNVLVDNWNLKMICCSENNITGWKLIDRTIVVHGTEEHYTIQKANFSTQMFYWGKWFIFTIGTWGIGWFFLHVLNATRDQKINSLMTGKWHHPRCLRGVTFAAYRIYSNGYIFLFSYRVYSN